MLGLQRPHRVRRRAVAQQLDRTIHPHRVLVGIGSAAGHQPVEYYTSRPTPPAGRANRPLKLEVRDCVGAVISPILANLFMHYAFDSWMARNFPGCPFERYADDVVVHCTSRRQAECVLARIATRMREVGLRLHPDKTRIVYCKDGRRRAEHEHTSFTFLGYAFRARGRAARTAGTSPDSCLRSAPRRSRPKAPTSADADPPAHRPIARRPARRLNPIIAGWINYYSRYYPTAPDPLLSASTPT